MDPTTQAASSPQVTPSEYLASLQPEQLNEFYATGKLPEAPKADPAPADPPKVEKAEPVEAKTDAEPAPANQQEQKERRKKNAESRILELLADNRKLQSELEEARKPKDAKADSSTAKPIEEPDPFTWTGTPEEYRKALQDFRKQEREQLKAELAREQFIKERDAQWGVQQAKAMATYSDYKETAKNAAEIISGSPYGAVHQFLDDSEVGPFVLYALGQQPEKLAEIMASSPTKAARLFVEMESMIKGELKKEDKPKVEVQDKTPAPKVTKAPPPPVEVNGGAQAPTDELAQAIKNKDFTRFKELEDERDLKRMGIRR